MEPRRPKSQRSRSRRLWSARQGLLEGSAALLHLQMPPAHDALTCGGVPCACRSQRGGLRSGTALTSRPLCMQRCRPPLSRCSSRCTGCGSRWTDSGRPQRRCGGRCTGSGRPQRRWSGMCSGSRRTQRSCSRRRTGSGWPGSRCHGRWTDGCRPAAGGGRAAGGQKVDAAGAGRAARGP